MENYLSKRMRQVSDNQGEKSEVHSFGEEDPCRDSD